MKWNRVTFQNLPKQGDLVWFCKKPEGGLNVHEKDWVPVIFLSTNVNTYLYEILLDELIVKAHITRLHIGIKPPDQY